MRLSPEDRPLFVLFAALLDYPGPDLAEQARIGAARLALADPGAAALLEDFRAAIGKLPPGALEELYTATFDLQPVCYPYLGYQLFGESYKRGAFLAVLKGHFHDHGFEAGTELPDHLPTVLRYLGTVLEADPELVDEGLVPALGRMAAAFKDQENPYGAVIQALAQFVGAGVPREAPQEAAVS